ncbi:hypothetical protein SLEP1_g268 [Rubroshorea leprosula]|uniref:F-box domain-containing protein n=1 Tax=Rubroshorea leprosula TaxID=152421 RepID=A0AAV5HKF9_9ROSI|nr:hypothetical protein SLEP1_g268 [Rubroshorea leprosula]
MPPPSFPSDMTEDILQLLPVKSLVRFKLVCSSWRSLISCSRFRKTHFNRAFQNPKLSAHKALLSTPSGFMLLDPRKPFGDNGGTMVDLTFPLEREDGHLRIAGSCNGLVCLVLDGKRDFFLWNPSTGDCNKLPEACTPAGQWYVHGFGYDSSSEDYKVVLVTNYVRITTIGTGTRSRTEAEVAIFSVKRNSWRILKDVNKAIHRLSGWNYDTFPESTFLNGVIHWMNDNFGTIIAFDLASETTCEFQAVSHRSGFFDMDLGVLGGCLCLIYDCYIEFELWVMKEYGVETSWTKLCNLVNPDSALYGIDDYASEDFYTTLCLCNSEDDAFILIRSRKELIRFNGRGEVLEKVCICNNSDNCDGIAFVESMVSANDP